jgi:plasmid stability protein
MATITIRNVPQHVVKSLKSLARKQRKSMEQEVRDILEDHTHDKLSAMNQIEAAWSSQTRRPKAREIQRWITQGRK